MKIRIVTFIIIGLLLAGGCKKRTEPKSPIDQQMEALALPTPVETSFRNSVALFDALTMMMKSYELTATDNDYLQLAKAYWDLSFSYDEEGLTDDGRKACATLKYRIDSVRDEAKRILLENLPDYRRLLFNENDQPLDETTEYPVFLLKGTKLYLSFETSGTATIRLLNADSRNTVRTWNGKKAISDSIAINNSAIYLVEVEPKDSPYISLTLERNCKNLQDVIKEYEINEEEIPCKANDFLAKKTEGISIKNLFETPRKVMLSSHGKALLSGNNRSVVAMPIPSNSTDVVYSLRISTNQEDHYSDGQFCKKVNERYKEIRYLGLPLYESTSTESNIFQELLNASEPTREEDAYCNLYIFTNSEEAKKFSDKKPLDELEYDIDFSKKSTQSCNDRIPTKGIKTLYFGFENTMVRHTVYLWLESISTASATEYYKTKYTLEE